MSQAQPPSEDDRPSSEAPEAAQPVPPSKASVPKPAPTDKLLLFFSFLQQLLGIVVAVVPLLLNLLGRLLKLLLKGLKVVQSGWAATLPKLRSRLPEPWKTQLPSSVLTAIALLFLLSFLSILFSLLPGKPPQVAKAPVAAVEQPKPMPVVTADRLVKIQDQLAEIANPYFTGLISAATASSRHSRLTLTLANSWYRLTPDQQDKLASDLLKRSHKLKFAQLELSDAKGTLLARSPVVGSGILILERFNAEAAIEPEVDEPAIDAPIILTPT